ncbi:haloacid dehalogenase superfamily, subfamily IA, variant 3 with third motif having DD or ED/haloacid dehalogenase superfamily, subfamily IA, variant 1 with third motif having Dx(3-4)D or Dx(3-4)E [Kaistella treverensis]|uniref:Haloacid dehalogenase superfamily, subfamily IA, variant 3 with third motif having DD or ED/haloacid dehalogenase superfamily, subfamily IA, variant 1 with third motif having Dx(3-4)D or Dx(3-4)E n=1 Tax=Kaistella treverensis TaxID=631455 RepID=A0A1I3MQD1_9FLAO|nr:HAD family phosphatase [Kaistella treverensis]SFI99159.1 haloacid dehalogenase superfamily, subfamily IA, variant 3 with third motif having DD or ED/haloacid dehalogenase superfamily, subfamily IA, variant 1 with third motif having Dx(3-4)D or Dx(3-4)E [Kaistella treverensis]
MPLKAVLFDMDGVIVDTEPLHRKAYFKMFDDLGIVVPEDLYTTFTGAATKKVCSVLIEKYGLNANINELAAIKRKYFKYFFYHDEDFALLPGVEDLIKNYFENGIKLVLASSASMVTIDMVFEKFKLAKYFIGKISGDDLKESKPNPEIFLLAAEIAQEPKENCVVIEDSTNGILAAHNAGIFCVAYKSEHSLHQHYEKANLLISDFSEITTEKISLYF